MGCNHINRAGQFVLRSPCPGTHAMIATLDRSAAWNFADPVIVHALPTTKTLDTFRVRLNAERARGTDVTIGFDITDTDELCGYHVRNQVAVFLDDAPEHPTATISATKTDVLAMFAGGDVAPEHIDGSEDAVREFFGLLDSVDLSRVNLILPN